MKVCANLIICVVEDLHLNPVKKIPKMCCTPQLDLSTYWIGLVKKWILYWVAGIICPPPPMTIDPA